MKYFFLFCTILSPSILLAQLPGTNAMATDALGRKLPSAKEVGEPKKDKFVGLFYWTWHTQQGSKNPPFNVTEYLARNPKALDDYNNPIWPKRNSPWFWSEPLFGYYLDTDEWVLRKHAEMLSDAGVDVLIFDCTNGNITWKESYMKLCEVFTQARKDGVKTPQIAFMLPFWLTEGGKEIVREIYRDLYKPGKYKDLFFMWKGKPLIMGMSAFADDLKDKPSDPSLINEIKNYFTFRPGQPVYNEGPKKPDHWGWLEIYPQHGYVKNANGGYEQATVGVAQNWSKARGLTAMNAPGAFGRSYTHANGHDSSAYAVNYGLNFQEQWNRALEINPEFIFITGWNEWIAGRWTSHDSNPEHSWFCDQANPEYSRDIEPSLSAGLKDNYYMQLVNNIRRYKGVQKIIPVQMLTIKLMNDWDKITVAYTDYTGDTQHRNHPGTQSIPQTVYTNTTGRNDFHIMKAAHDVNNLYFYAETAANITLPSGDNWMMLWIDADKNPQTGWYGYDYRVVKGRNLQQYINNNWRDISKNKIKHTVEKNRMTITVPVKLLTLLSKPLQFEFKWSDNMKEENPLDWYINGDAAPGGRFNFQYGE